MDNRRRSSKNPRTSTSIVESLEKEGSDGDVEEVVEEADSAAAPLTRMTDSPLEVFPCPAIAAAKMRLERRPPPAPRLDVDQLYEYPFRKGARPRVQGEPCTLPQLFPPRPCPDLLWTMKGETTDLATSTMRALQNVDFTEAMEEMERTEKTHPEAVAEAMVKKILEAIKYKKEDEKIDERGERGESDERSKFSYGTFSTTSSETSTVLEEEVEVPRSVVEAMVERIWDAVMDLRDKTKYDEIAGETEEDHKSAEVIADKILRQILDEMDTKDLSEEFEYPLKKLAGYYESLKSVEGDIIKSVVDDVLKDVHKQVPLPKDTPAEDIVKLLLYKAERKAEESSTSEEEETPRPESPRTKHRPLIWIEEEKRFEIYWNLASPRGNVKRLVHPDDDASSFSRFNNIIDAFLHVIHLIKAWHDERKAKKKALKQEVAEKAAGEVLEDMLEEVQEPEIVAGDILDNLVDAADEPEKMVTDLITDDVMDKVDGANVAALDIMELLFGKAEEPEKAANEVVDDMLQETEDRHKAATDVLDEIIENADEPRRIVEDVLQSLIKNVDSSEAVAAGVLELVLQKIEDREKADDILLALKRYQEYENYFPERKPEWSPEPVPDIPKELFEALMKLQAATECWLTNILDPDRPLSPPEPEEIIIVPTDITGKEPKEEEQEEEEKPEDFINELLREMCEVPLEGEKIFDSVMKKVEEPILTSEGILNRIIDEAGAADLAAAETMDIMLKNLNESDAVINNLMDWIMKTQVDEPSNVVNNLLDDLIKVVGEPDTVIEDIMDSILKHLHDYDNADDMVTNILDLLLGDLGEEVLAKFVLKDNKCFSRVYKATIHLRKIRDDLAELCDVPKDMIVLYLDGVLLLSKDIFYEDKPMRLIRKKRCVLNFALFSYDPLRYPLRTEELTQETPRVTTRVIKVHMDKYESRLIRITTFDETINKPYVGGYRNKKTGIELHHAFTQTGPRPKRLPEGVTLTHRDTQTAQLKHRDVETVIYKTQQMWRNDVYISPEYDYIITAKPYIDADEALRKLKLDENAAIIQRAWRRYLLRKNIRRFAYQYRLCKEYDVQFQIKYTKVVADRHKDSLVRKTYPRTRTDFEAWYGVIEKWRLAQTKIIEEEKDPAARKAALQMVLLREIDLLRELDTHRTRLKEEKREKIGLKFVDACSKPVQWTSSDGCLVSMDTTRTQRARELREIYYLLARYNCTVEERIEILMNVKYSLRAHNTLLSLQLTKLLERESECILAGVEEKEIDILRQRILQLYLELLKDPDFNPEGAKNILEYNTNKLECTFLRCNRCRRLVKKVDASMEANVKALRFCDECYWIQFIGSRRWPMFAFRNLMRAIRREEASLRCYSSVAFVMQDVDFYWLIDNLWHSQSFLTEKRDIQEMRMPRWNKCEDWSPWNCILLTNYEAKWHKRLPSLEQGYSKELVTEVKNRHLTAKLHFRRLLKTDQHYRESCKWYKVSKAKSYLAPSEPADSFT